MRWWALAALVVLVAYPAAAADFHWANPAGGSFANPANWQEGSVPGPLDTAFFDLAAVYSVLFAADAENRELSIPAGTVTFDLDGSTYTINLPGSTVFVGSAGQAASIHVSNGVLAASEGSFGDGAAAEGSFLVSGSGGAALFGDFVLVGRMGTGTLTVTDGAAFTADLVYLGDQSSGVGSLEVSGGSTLETVCDDLTVGFFGAGDAIFSGGAAVETRGGFIGRGSGSSGEVIVTDPGTLWNPSIAGSWVLYVGETGLGTLHILDGGTVATNSETNVGFDSSAVGSITVSGSGSLLDINDRMWLGREGSGTLVIEEGGEVDVASHISMAPIEGSIGLAQVNGAGSRLVSGKTLTVATSGSATVELDGGIVEATSVDIRENGLLAGTGEIITFSLAVEGILRPEVGLAVTGPLELADGTVEVTLRGADVGGTFVAATDVVQFLGGDSLVVELDPSYTPQTGDTFTICSSGIAIVGEFENVVFPPGPVAWELTELGDDLVLEAIPIPLTFVRGDVNQDEVVGLADGILILNALFLMGPLSPCLEAMNTNGDALLGIDDALHILFYLFLNGPPPPPPFPDCGAATQIQIGCDEPTCP